MSTTMACAKSEALFASNLQPSDKPTDDQIRAAVLEALKDDGIAKCAAHVAQEFGEHPEIAVRRMNWAIDCIERSYPDAA